MSSSNKNKIYTAPDFERYHSGNMTEQEMHTLERHALDDPFLADALEGYVYTPTAAKDIHDLKQKIKDENKTNTGIAFINPKTLKGLIKIAAIFIVIAGVGYWAYQAGTDKSVKNVPALAKNERIEVKKEFSGNAQTQSDNFKKTDTIESRAKNNSVKSILASQAEPGLRQEEDNEYKNEIAKLEKTNVVKEKKYYDTSLSAFDKISNQNVHVPLNQTQNELPGRLTTDSGMIAKTRKQEQALFLKGKVISSTGEMVPFASITTLKDKKNFRTDAQGSFAIPVTDSTGMANIAALGYGQKQQKLDVNQDQTVVLDQNTRELSEVAVASVSKSRKQSIAAASSPVKKTDLTFAGADDTASYPLKGWAYFNEYIINNKKIFTDENGKNYYGRIILSFEVNRKGTPVKIKTEQSLCVSCDEETVRLLREGPKWNYIKNKRSRVTIQF